MFAVLQVSEATTLDFIIADGDTGQLHYAFLVAEAEFDEIFERIRQRNLPYWSDPSRENLNEVNH